MLILVNFLYKIGIQLRIEISACFSSNFQFRAEVKKVTSRESGSSLIFADWIHSSQYMILNICEKKHVKTLFVKILLNTFRYKFCDNGSFNKYVDRTLSLLQIGICFNIFIMPAEGSALLFTNYVDKFFFHLTPFVYSFYLIKMKFLF